MSQKIKSGYIDSDGSSNGQVLTSNGTAVYWSSPGAASVDQSAQYNWTNTHTFNANLTFANTSGISANGTFGTSGQVLTTNGSSVYWSTSAGGGGSEGGYYKGNDGAVGSASNANNLFRINSNTISNNITIASGENALTAGPLTIQTGQTLTISSGGRAVII